MAITKVTEGARTLGTGEVATANMATDPTNASNLSSGSVPAAQLGNVDTSGIVANQDDIALLGFKVAANGSLARYNLVDQSIDAFEDASGVDASGSTNEVRNASNYYSGGATGALVAKTATGVSTYTPPAGITAAEILLVAGGGGGGDPGTEAGGGGGAGGVVHISSYTLVPGVEYDITVGTAGAKGSGGSPTGGDGVDSVFNVNAEGSGATMTALGGGGGGQYSTDGNSGGSGGGQGAQESSPNTGTGDQGDSGGGTGYGNDGGTGATNGGDEGGGGGGANAVGADASSGDAGDGGAGKLFSTFVAYGTDSSNVASTGSNGGYFAGGGGGGDNSGGTGTGTGGVGGGADGKEDQAAVDGQVNTGGGGASVGNAGTPSDGGTGIVLINEADAILDMTLISNAQTANDGAPDNGDLVITYSDGAGTAVANTNIKAYISRDGSAYTSAVTLVSQGTTGGHTILTANGVDLSGITSGTSMRWKIETLVQSASMDTRIQAVSLGWS